ncbi:asparagine synthase (glutamine-hydrolyzing) [Silvibacterium bohemicum]|uniref:asparagine synthase (glutamine-hydrolyzing) n=1 Tax=Silvibacterium bohemicum TaxID=1577686 RepID=A0A841JZ57_9BACT|nr:asparagine synthase-related protein [Silvibacterium bohemicum]MBB6143718.1 asparagine synthase (glutamine-hydrolyzing) [Silvibacterium bohemicum]
MSILFGIRQAEEQAVEEPRLRRIASATERYALDGTYLKASGRIGMGFQPYHTHERSNLESQPVVSRRGDMLTFDGRLDNYIDLCHSLCLDPERTPDSLIVIEAFLQWGEDCFSRFVGDWALALWAHAERSLYLARDHAGTRTLYYEMANGRVLWSTYLESLVPKNSARGLDEAFAAAFLSSLPIRDLTPYRGVRAVSPAHYVIIHEGAIARKSHWQWMVREKVHYRSDTEYDEHFFSLFRQSVERRTGSGAAILAELSGGMDSSSIVCMSDHIRKEQGAAPVDLLDTVSYYDDSEPNWNETPYFTAVEQGRGKCGLHIKASSHSRTFEPPAPEYLWPGPEASTFDAERRLEDQLRCRRYRVVLSGIGGDELLGGPPNPVPELADYLVSGEFQKLIHQAFRWCVAKRVPLIHLLRDTASMVFTLYPRLPRSSPNVPPWLTASIRKEVLGLRLHDFSRVTIGHLPSSLDNGMTWWSIMETLVRPSQRIIGRREYRYPFLDRDLVDFLLRVPANQLMCPGRRRLLMRRALRGIIPSHVLERKRKAYVSRSPLVVLYENKPRLMTLMHDSKLNRLHYIEEDALRTAVAAFDAPPNAEWQYSLIRAIHLELWLRAIG